MPTEIILASTNEGKVRELVRLFDEPRISLTTMKEHVPPGFEVDETGTTFRDNAWLKALEVCKLTGRPALSDDSGLEVDALSGRPGVYSARFAGVGASDEANNQLLLRELEGVPDERRTARFICVLAFAVPGPAGPVRVATYSGSIEGRIIHSPRGNNGFGYDPLFEPLERSGVTTAEIPPEEKNQISHRAKAARGILPLLQKWLAHEDRATL
jgi:XTP/dITP diphosphohydrolase